MPTPTDLVTDLPADFEVFGQGVDTAFADLNGGTTGQVLAKTSATNLDFTWTTPQVGDITGVTAGTGLTGGGTSGTVSLEFDQANYGGGQFSAGKNKIINGDFGINQRAFTSITTTATYGFDRWMLQNSDGTVTYTPQTFTLGAAPVAGYEGTNFAQIVTTGQTLTSAFATLSQRIESVRTLAGQTATISFWAKANTGTPNVLVNVNQNFGSGGSPSASVNTTSAAQTITTSWVRYSFTIANPSISGKTIGTTNDGFLSAQIYVSGGSATTGAAVGIQSNTFQIWGVQVEAGSTATPFQTATGTKQGELAACQRYYYRITPLALDRSAVGFVETTTTAELAISFPATMRTNPTALEQSGTATDYSVRSAAGNTVCSAVPLFIAANVNYACFRLTVAAGLTLGNAALNRSVNTAAYFAWSAEL